MFVALSLFRVISWIPRGALFGLFLYLGMGALHGNEIWERIMLCMMVEKKRPAIPVVREVQWRTVQAFTAIQAVCALTIFAVAQFAEVGYIYPALLTALVPFRSYVLCRFFKEEDMKYLDPHGSDEDEEHYHEEQRAYHLAQRNDSFDSEELNPPNRAAFRGQGKSGLIHRRHTTTELEGTVNVEEKEITLAEAGLMNKSESMDV
jgi:hypothetical protein